MINHKFSLIICLLSLYPNMEFGELELGVGGLGDALIGIWEMITQPLRKSFVFYFFILFSRLTQLSCILLETWVLYPLLSMKGGTVKKR